MVFFRYVIHLQDFCMMYFLETPVLFCFVFMIFYVGYDIVCIQKYLSISMGPTRSAEPTTEFFYYFGLNIWEFALNLYFFFVQRTLRNIEQAEENQGRSLIFRSWSYRMGVCWMYYKVESCCTKQVVHNIESGNQSIYELIILVIYMFVSFLLSYL